jgi:endonuclease/exonuclease/phosphatase family metal-dependent hydrolase
MNMEDKFRLVKRIIKGVLIALLIIVIVFMAFLGIMTLFEYNPRDWETLEIMEGDAEKRAVAPGDELTLMTFNVGYGGMGEAQPENAEDMERSLEGAAGIISGNPADVYFVQEVDRDSKRSFEIDELLLLYDEIKMDAAFATNYKSAFVPYPVPPIGKVHGGIATFSTLEAGQAQRISLPAPFSWPARMFKLKQCLLTERVPLEGGSDLVLVNLHMEAHDAGEEKEEQTRMLMELIRKEYQDGNYVIAGGDFNQEFPRAGRPVVDGDRWRSGVLEEDLLPEGFRYVTDVTIPTCGLGNGPYADGGTRRYYVTDGFIVSPDIQVLEVETLDEGFRSSDHNPVRITVRLMEQDK